MKNDNTAMKQQRAATHATLGSLIDELSKLPPTFLIDAIGRPHSYRGYYSDLAFERYSNSPKMTVWAALGMLNGCLGAKFMGYKGGSYTMGRDTPVWIANYGCCGLKIMGLNADGTFHHAGGRMKTVTAETILSWRPCWVDAETRIRQLVTDPVSALDILSRRDGMWAGVRDKDRLWAVLRVDLIDYSTLRTFACDCAERALLGEREAGREPDIRSWEAIHVSRLYAAGKAAAKQLAAAEVAAEAARSAAEAARSAAWAARDAAAWTAAEAAACAAEEAARDAAWAARVAARAARSAPWAAPWASEEAESRWQVEHLIGILSALAEKEDA